MYYLTKLVNTVRVPPSRFEEPLEEVVMDILTQSLVGTFDKKLGFMIAIKNIEDIGVGKVIIGDGAAYYDVTFNALFFKPELHEIIEGEVIEITEFGAFVRIGPVDGLVHISQITDDYIDYDPKNCILVGKETKRVLKEGDKVRARIVAISTKQLPLKVNIGLTMRQPGLGKLEWIEEEKKKKEKKENKK